MTTRPTSEQKAAREQLAENRRKTREKKIRDRRLYRVGEVMEAYGYEESEDVEELMRTIDEALAYGERDRDSEASFDAAIERAIEESERAFQEERRLGSESPPLGIQLPVRRRSTVSASLRVAVVACAGTLLGLSAWELWRQWRRGGGGWTR